MNVSGSLYRPMVTRWYDSSGKLVRKSDASAVRSKKVRSETWRAKYKDRSGRQKSKTLGTTDKAEAQIRLAELLDSERRGVADPYADHRERPLTDHFEDYIRSLDRQNKSEKHLAKVRSYVGRIIQGCGFQTVADFDAERVAEYLHERRQPQPVTRVSLKHVMQILSDLNLATTERRLRGMSLPGPCQAARRGSPALWEWHKVRKWLSGQFECTLPRVCPIPDAPGLSEFAYNDHVASLKAFANWLVKNDRLLKSPFRILSKLNVEEAELRHERRAASRSDFDRLMKATAAASPFRGLTGTDRVMLYLTAVGTGFRASELGSLTFTSFDFESAPPTVSLKARSSKRRRKDTQPLQRGVAAILASYFRSIQSERKSVVWPGTWVEKGAMMLRRDLEAAGLPYRDEAGRVLDFHSLRGTFATNLVRAGVSPAKTQELMRHSDVNLTMRHYKKLDIAELAQEVERLPAEINVALDVALGRGDISSLQGLSDVSGVQIDAEHSNEPDAIQSDAGQEFTVKLAAHKKEPPMRLELMTYALRKRRSAD